MSVVGLVVVAAVLVAATAFGLWRRSRDGRLVTDNHDRVDLSELGALGERATLVQFSSAFCRPCVATRHVLAGVAARVPGVEHVEVDAESHLELVRSLGIASTPTTLVVDAAGAVRGRATGVPSTSAVLVALDSVVG